MSEGAFQAGEAPAAWVVARFNGRKRMVLDRPRVIAILNLTPDSFSDGGSWETAEKAAAGAARFVSEGADGLDLGGESTRPGAAAVPAAVQIERVIPSLKKIRREIGDEVVITIDTTMAEVARAALDHGADAINDISAGSDERMLPLAGERGVGVILMHRLKPPGEDSYSDAYVTAPMYSDRGVVQDVAAYLAERAAAAMIAGVGREQIVLDPGLGFGKTVAQNLALIDGTGALEALGFPILSGVSRKSFTARAAGMSSTSAPCDRVHATVGLSVVHLMRGARLFRVHDVAAHVPALRAAWSAMSSRPI